MRQVRFFEDSGAPGGGRRLLVGILDYEEHPLVDGGRHEAVHVATMADVEAYPAEYAEYYRSFSPTGQAAAAPDLAAARAA